MYKFDKQIVNYLKMEAKSLNHVGKCLKKTQCNLTVNIKSITLNYDSTGEHKSQSEPLKLGLNYNNVQIVESNNNKS